jgi:hypothetical protein
MVVVKWQCLLSQSL